MSVRKVRENKRRQRKVSVNFRKARVFRPGTQHRAAIYEPPHWDPNAAEEDEFSRDEDEAFFPLHLDGWGGDF